jgi:DNA processing protein
MTTDNTSPDTKPTSSTKDTAARIALACAGLTGDPTVAVAIETLGNAESLVAAVHDGRDRMVALSALTRSRIRAQATGARVARALEAARAAGAHVITPNTDGWPTQLGGLRHVAPFVLWIRGDRETLGMPSIAMTGALRPSPAAIHLCLELATGLAQRGWVIASGCNPGIDDIATRAANSMQERTIVITPACTQLLRCGEGCPRPVLVSELPPGAIVTVRAQRRAKHLLAAIAAKTIIIEAGRSSGPLRTAEAAHAIGRPVGVASADPAVGLSAGCADLVARHGLTVVSTITDADRLR